jgi:DNA mismatch repair ATPase MutS|tara:strand:- start:803 stop:2338 length:1536 start_codon:yes stop_codon:yes gene_type:complete
MPFHSILLDQLESEVELNGIDMPSFFQDLNLDQVFQSVMEGFDEYNLKPFFVAPLNNVKTITYRQEILQDLEGETLRRHIDTFAEKMRYMREHLARAEKVSYEDQKERWFLDAVEIYCSTVKCLADEISHLDVKSKGFRAFREYLKAYINSEHFKSLLDETKKLKDDLLSITYCIKIRQKKVTVRKYEAEPDYSSDIEVTFRKFQQVAINDYQFIFPDSVKMNNIEEDIMNRVALLYPDIFQTLHDYYVKHQDYLDQTISRFDREVQFYIAYLDFIEKIKLNGLKFCYPHVFDQSKEIHAYETFDLALANKLLQENLTVVCNDFYMKDLERVFVVSGPNQGGKTTFARTFGQLHYLASLGYPVPGRKAQLFMYDQLFTHFEKEENIEDLRGKLQDELVRIHDILQQATSNSIIIINEGFISTTLNDALFLGREVLQQIIQRDILCVYVTFIDELSILNDATVSMMSTIIPENPTSRTYKVIRRPADGRAYAISIAEKYELTYEPLKRRIVK